jgi:hypothetical protein
MPSQPALLIEYATLTRDASVSWFLRDSRIEIRHADGRHALRTGSERYDVIEADALRPSSAYAGNLYSVEFFRLVQSRLKKGGLAATWVPTPRVLDTLRRVFPHVVYLGNLVALGSDTPIDVNWPAVRTRLMAPDVRAHFFEGQVDIVTLMTPVFSEGATPLPPLETSQPVDANTDMHPRDELPAPANILRGLIGR